MRHAPPARPGTSALPFIACVGLALLGPAVCAAGAAPISYCDPTPAVLHSPAFKVPQARVPQVGQVVVQVTVHEDGTVTDPLVISSDVAPDANWYDATVLSAAAAFRYAKVERPCLASITFRFNVPSATLHEERLELP